MGAYSPTYNPAFVLASAAGVEAGPAEPSGRRGMRQHSDAPFWADASVTSSLGVGWTIKVSQNKTICPTGVFVYNRKQLLFPQAGTLQLS